MPSYEKNTASGLWSVRFRETKEDGKRHQKRLSGYKTRRDAQYAYEDYLKSENIRIAEEKARKEAEKVSCNTPFSELCEMFLSYKKARTKSTSFCDVERRINTKILPFFEKKLVGEITPAEVLSWLDGLSEYSHNYRKTIFSTLTSIFAFGKRYHNIDDPTEVVERPRRVQKKKEMDIYTPEEFSLLKDHFVNKDHAFFFYFLFISGCRRGEALALTWEDIDEKKGSIEIKKSYSKKTDEKGIGFIITSTKNEGSDRIIYLPRSFFKALAEYKKDKDLSLPFVFGGKSPFPVTNLQRALATAADEAGLKRIRIHDFRHSCASFLLHKGVSIVAVSRHLGHTSVEQTLNTYAHILPDDRAEILKNLDALRLSF